MKRRKFIKTCCYTAIVIPLLTTSLQSCDAIYYATSIKDTNHLIVKKSEFWHLKGDKKVHRSFILIKTEDMEYPICLYRVGEDEYSASLLLCTHRGCELNVGGGIYTCPCHGSEFSVTGKVLEGPADRDLKTFETEQDHENIYILHV